MAANKPIAVLAGKIISGRRYILDYIRQTYPDANMEKYHQHQRTFYANGQEYVLVTKIEEAIGYEFKSYMITPCFHELEEYVKSRIRN